MIDVIIPTYNRKETLERAIESVLAQTFREFKLYVVDDASNDGTDLLIRKYVNKLTYLQLPKNHGVSFARNFAVKQSQSSWLAFLDSDDEWLPNKLEKQVAFLTDHPEYKIVHGNEIWIRNGKFVNQMKKHEKSGGDVFQRSLELCLISPSAVLIQRQLYEDLKGFREDFIVCEDYDLWLKICCRHNIGFISDPIIRKFGGHEDQLSHKYKAMDYYRVLSIDYLLKSGSLNSMQIEMAKSVLFKKLNILLMGYKKHQNEEKYREMESILKFHQC